jgi:hypothetical protein
LLLLVADDQVNHFIEDRQAVGLVQIAPADQQHLAFFALDTLVNDFLY